MKIFDYPVRYHQNEREDQKLFFVPYSHYPCTKKSGMPIKIRRVWKGPFALRGTRMPSSSKHWMNKKNFYGEHVSYTNVVTRRKIKTRLKYVLLTLEEHVQWIEAKQTNSYRSLA